MSRINKFVRYILPVIVAVIAVVGVIFYPVKCENISAKLFLNGSEDGDRVKVVLANSDKDRYTADTYSYGGCAVFSIPSAYTEPAAVFVRCDSDSKSYPYAISLYTGTNNPETDTQLCFTVLSKTEITKRSSYTVSEFSDSDVASLTGYIGFNYKFKLPVVFAILLILAVYELSVSFCKDEAWCKNLRKCICAVLLIAVSASFLFNAQLFRSTPRYKNTYLYESHNGKTASAVTFSKSVSQIFKAENNHIEYVRVYFDATDNSAVPTVGVKLIKAGNTTIAEKVIDKKEIVSKGYAELKFNGIFALTKGTEYKVELKPLDSTAGKILIYKDDSVKNIGTVNIDGKKTSASLYAAVGYNQIGFSNIYIISAIILCSVAVLFSLFCNKFKKGNSVHVAVIYGLLFVIAVFETAFFLQYFKGTLCDENASLSYIAGLTDKSVLNFNPLDSKLLTLSDNGAFVFSTDANYIVNPPLYYSVMKMFGLVKISGALVYVNIDAIRYVTAFIGLIGVLISMYTGYSKINRNLPVMHLLYGSILISFPSVLYTFTGVGVYSFVFLGVSLYVLGIVKLKSRRKMLLGYFVLSLGIFITALSSAFAGAIVLAVTVLEILARFITDKTFKFICRKAALAALPLVLLTVGYYVIFALKFGYIPFNFRGYSDEYIRLSSGKGIVGVGTVFEYCKHYFTGFFYGWTGIQLGASFIKSDTWFSVERIIQIAVAVSPLIVIFKCKGRKYSGIISRFYFVISAFFIYQFVSAVGLYTAFGSDVYCFAQNYLCFMPFFAFAAVYPLLLLQGSSQITDIEESRPTGYVSINPKRFVTVICVLISSLLMYEGIISFLVKY